jgi:hypothetical protein
MKNKLSTSANPNSEIAGYSVDLIAATGHDLWNKTRRKIREEGDSKTDNTQHNS